MNRKVFILTNQILAVVVALKITSGVSRVRRTTLTLVQRCGNGCTVFESSCDYSQRHRHF